MCSSDLINDDKKENLFLDIECNHGKILIDFHNKLNITFFAGLRETDSVSGEKPINLLFVILLIFVNIF